MSNTSKHKHHRIELRLATYFIQHVKAIKRSLLQLNSSPIASCMTCIVIGIALAMPLGLYTLLKNAQIISHNINETTQISLYLNTDVQKSQVDDLIHTLRTNRDIAKIRYISPEAGLQSLQERLGVDNILTGLENNPLPGVIVAQPAPIIRTTLQVNQLLSQLKQLPGIEHAQFDLLWLQRLQAIIHFGERLIIAVMFLFGLAVLLIISNTIRLIIQNYQDEITVIKLLGGTNSFVRRPFLYSGVIYGLTGSIIAWLFTNAFIGYLQTPASELSNLYGFRFHLEMLSFHSTFYLLISGILLGLIGSWFAVNRQLTN